MIPSRKVSVGLPFFKGGLFRPPFSLSSHTLKNLPEKSLDQNPEQLLPWFLFTNPLSMEMYDFIVLYGRELFFLLALAGVALYFRRKLQEYFAMVFQTQEKQIEVTYEVLHRLDLVLERLRAPERSDSFHSHAPQERGMNEALTFLLQSLEKTEAAPKRGRPRKLVNKKEES